MLCCGSGSKEFCFSGTGGGDGLRLASAGHSAATQEEGTAHSGSAVAQIIGMCGIKEGNGFLSVNGGKIRWLSIHCGADEIGRR